MKNKSSTLWLGICLVLIACIVFMFGIMVDREYVQNGTPGLRVRFSDGDGFVIPLQVFTITCSCALLAAGLWITIRCFKRRNKKQITLGTMLMATSLLLFVVNHAMYREACFADLSFNYFAFMAFIIFGSVLFVGIAKKSMKILIVGAILTEAALILSIIAGFAGLHIYSPSEYVGRQLQATAALTQRASYGFNFRFFFVNPPIYITFAGICGFLAFLMAEVGLAMLFGRMMSRMGLKASRHTTNILIYVVLAVMSVIWLIPFFLIVVESFREFPLHQVGDIFGTKPNPQEPIRWGFGNYVALLSGETNFLRWYINTLIIALFVAVFQTIIVLCMSYTLSRFRFKMRKILMRFMLVLTLFPGMLTMIILYRVLADAGLTKQNAVPGLILVYIASSGMGYYVSKGFFDTIPKSLDEAARVDGATRFQVLWKIILPLSKPIVIYTILTAFMGPWGDFVFARYISMNEPLGMNVAVGLNSWLSKDQINDHYTHFCAGGVLVAIPVTILFMCLQRYYVEGVTGGAVKG